MDIIASPSTVIPLLLLLILIIYYLLSLTGALREANQDLKNQLRRERQEERRKMLQRVVNAKLDDSGGNDAISKWRKVLEASSPVTPNAPGQPVEPDEEKMKARREFLARIMKKALRKSSNTSEDECDDGDETDNDDQHEQLPHDQDTTHERRTPIKGKKSSVTLLDERKPEQSSHTQVEQQQPHSHHHKHPSHHHHHHRHQQQPPRKLSFMQLRDIVETSQPKSEPKPAETKPTKHIAAERKDKEKAIKADDSAKAHAQAYAHAHEDDYNKVNVVSERRALRRQQNARESEGSLSLQLSLPDAANFDVVNEKPKVEKPPRSKSPQKSTSPEIFKFDTEVAEARSNLSSSKENDESDMDQSSSKETAKIEISKTKVPIQKDSSSSQSKNASPTTSIQLHSPKGRGTNNSSSASTPRKDPLKSPSPAKSNSQSPSPSPSEKIKHTEDILNKPIRKLNSFLALVKEAVQAKKQEQQRQKEQQQQKEQQHEKQQPSEPQQYLQQHQLDTNPDGSPLISRVKLFIDDSNSVSMTESTRTESVASSTKNTTYFESIRRLRHHAEPPKPKRQDSQTSIWSENIPVITISKSESDECILERDNDDVESPDTKSPE